MMGLHTLHTIVMDLKIICANENLHYIKETLEKRKGIIQTDQSRMIPNQAIA